MGACTSISYGFTGSIKYEGDCTRGTKENSKDIRDGFGKMFKWVDKKDGKGEYVITHEGNFRGDKPYRNFIAYHEDGKTIKTEGMATPEGLSDVGNFLLGALISVDYINYKNAVEYDETGKKIYEGDMKGESDNSSGVISDAKRDGKGKEFDKDGKVIYDGEWKDGKRVKKGGSLYDKKGNLLYSGEMKNGLPHGNGIAYKADGSIGFKGKFKGGKICN
jgi:antitoxin component YwqK of YwqJK toxin-antitoxin module